MVARIRNPVIFVKILDNYMLRVFDLRFPMVGTHRLFSLIGLLGFITLAKAEQSNIHQICSQSPSKCLNEIDRNLAKEEKGSRGWYKLELYKIESLFQLTHFKTLEEEVTPWVGVKNLPLKFEINY